MRPNKDKPVTVRAIHPNVGVRRWYEAELIAFVNVMHEDVRAAVLGAYSAIEPAEFAHDTRSVFHPLRVDAAGNFACWYPDMATDADPPNSSLFIRRALTRIGKKWTLKIEKLSLELSRKFARKAFGVTQIQMKAAFKDAGFTVKFDPTPGSIAAYQAVAAEQVNLIRSIPAQYLKDVQTKVWASVMKGGDMHALSVDLRETYGITRERAALIAGDQNAKAKATIERTRRQEIGVTHAIWMHSAGGKVPRKTHVKMDGKAYLISAGMWDSDEGAYVLPGELINCRCTSKAVLPAVDNVAEAVARAKASRPRGLLESALARAR